MKRLLWLLLSAVLVLAGCGEQAEHLTCRQDEGLFRLDLKLAEIAEMFE